MGIACQIVQLTLAGAVFDVAPVRRPQAVEIGVALELLAAHPLLLGIGDEVLLELTALDQEALAPGLGRVGQQRQERAAVDEGRRLDPGDLGEGRGEVDVERHRVDPLALGHARTAHHHRHPEVFLVGRILAGDQAVLAHVEAVVGGVDDVGGSRTPAGGERRDDALDHVVDRLQASAAAAVLVLEPGDRGLVEGGSRRMTPGLSPTSASLNAGGRGSSASTNRSLWRGGGDRRAVRVKVET